MERRSVTDGRALLARQTAKRNIALRGASALGGLSVAYIGARLIMFQLSGVGVVDVGRLARELAIFFVLAAITLALTSVVPIRTELLQIQRLVVENEDDLRQRNRVQRFQRRVQTAFEMAETDSELFTIAGLAMRHAADHPGEILVADSSHAHLDRLVRTVTTPQDVRSPHRATARP